uniref:G-protein coupled receptors family 1 profile domain-containing protein n=1 Tax=Macaca fascicularis TaxID=9541 RepID=A0A7N9CB53_MACFA
KLKSNRWSQSPDLVNKIAGSEFVSQLLSTDEKLPSAAWVTLCCPLLLVWTILLIFTYMGSRGQKLHQIRICILTISPSIRLCTMPGLLHSLSLMGIWVFGLPECLLLRSIRKNNTFKCNGIVTIRSVALFLTLGNPKRTQGWFVVKKTMKINILHLAKFIMALHLWVHSSIIRSKDNVQSCFFDLNSEDDFLMFFLVLTITMFNFPLEVILVCSFLFVCVSAKEFDQSKDRCRNPRFPASRTIKMHKMAMVVFFLFILQPGPYLTVSLLELELQELTLAYISGLLISRCVTYATTSITSFLYLIKNGNFKRKLPEVRQRCSNKKIKYAGQNIKPHY